MDKLVIIAQLQIHPQHFQEYLTRAKVHAARSLKEDPGCRQFDVLVAEEPPNLLVLYEIYDDEASFVAHTQTARMAEHRKATQGMVQDRKLFKCRGAA